MPSKRAWLLIAGGGALLVAQRLGLFQHDVCEAPLSGQPGTGVPPIACCAPCDGSVGVPTGDYAAMVRANAAIAWQMVAWQHATWQRCQAGKPGCNPLSWPQFRMHLAAVGMPDPGFYPPAAFLRFGGRLA